MSEKRYFKGGLVNKM